MNPVHLALRDGTTACRPDKTGLPSHWDPGQVTCGNCRRKAAYKKRLFGKLPVDHPPESRKTRPSNR